MGKGTFQPPSCSPVFPGINLNFFFFLFQEQEFLFLILSREKSLLLGAGAHQSLWPLPLFPLPVSFQRQDSLGEGAGRQSPLGSEPVRIQPRGQGFPPQLQRIGGQRPGLVEVKWEWAPPEVYEPKRP